MTRKPYAKPQFLVSTQVRFTHKNSSRSLTSTTLRPVDYSPRAPPFRLDRASPVKMKLNISYPANGSQKIVEVDDERKLRPFMEKRMGTDVPADSLGDEFKGYLLKITGGNDKQGFPMKQGGMYRRWCSDRVMEDPLTDPVQFSSRPVPASC